MKKATRFLVAFFNGNKFIYNNTPKQDTICLGVSINENFQPYELLCVMFVNLYLQLYILRFEVIQV